MAVAMRSGISSQLILLVVVVVAGMIFVGASSNSNTDKFMDGNSAEPTPTWTPLNKKRLLLTGASGFGGSHALDYFLTNSDWHIVCPITFEHHGLPARIVNAIGEDTTRMDRVRIIKCDLSCPIDDLTAKQIGSVDYIINYASESSVDRSIVNPVPFVKNNINIVLHLLELARAVKPKAFILISTDEVYGPSPTGIAHEEWSPIIPSNPYSASKAAQEAIAISYWRTFGVPLIIVNCMNLIGETQDPEKLVPLVISKVIKGRSVPIHASIGKNGSEETAVVGSRFYLHARHLADAIHFLLQRNSISMYTSTIIDRPDRWNIVGPHEINNLDMAQLIANFIGKPLQYKFVDFHHARPGHDMRYALNGNKIMKAGWNVPTEFNESLKQVVQWTLDKPLWADRDRKYQRVGNAGGMGDFVNPNNGERERDFNEHDETKNPFKVVVNLCVGGLAFHCHAHNK